MKAGWEVKPLGAVSKVAYGYTAKASSEIVGPKFLRITDVQNGCVDWGNVPYCPIDEKDHQKHKLEAGNIVFARTGATTGKSYLIESPPDAVCASYLIKVSNLSDVLDPRFLILYFNTDEYWEDVDAGTEGAAQGGFNASKLKALQIPIPPLEEQKRIVAVLDAAFEGLTRAKENAEANLQNARELFESRTSHIFSQSGNEQLSSLGDAIEILTGFAFKSAGYSENPTDMAMVRGDNIVQGQFRWKNVKRWPQANCAEFEKFRLAANDLLLAMDRTWVKDGIKFAVVSQQDLPLLLVQRVARLRCLANLSHVYLGHFIGSKQFEQYVLSIQTGMGVPHISGQQIKDCPLYLPSLETQTERANELTDLRRMIDGLVADYTTKLTDIADLRQSLLQKAFAGELT